MVLRVRHSATAGAAALGAADWNADHSIEGADQFAPRQSPSFTGHVGIGTISPGTPLEVAGGAANTFVRVRNSANLAFDVGVGGAGTAYVFNRADTNLILGTNNFEKLIIWSSGAVAPAADNTQTLGGSSNRWSVVYAGTGTINTSDAREKTPVRPLSAAEIAAARDLSAEIGVYQWLDMIEEKGADEARLHIGMTVQRAIEIMEAHGLDPWRYGFICRDEITRRVVVTQSVIEQAVDEVEVPYTEIEIRGGVPVLVRKTRTVQEPRTQMVAVVDEAGQPVERDGKPLLHPVPVMIEVEHEVEVDEPAGERLGFRDNQLAHFMLAGLLARIEALEG